MKKTLLMALCAVGTAHVANAVEFNGGNAEIAYSAFTDDSGLSRTAAFGSAEIGFSRMFALQGDLGVYRFNELGENGQNAALHAVFHINNAASLGLFVARDDLWDGNATYFGAEAGFEFSGIDTEVYLASADDDDVSGNMFGLDMSYGFQNNLGVRGRLDRIDFDNDVDLTRFSVGLEYHPNPSSTIYGEIGSLNADGYGLSGSETFIGVGARINFGSDRGATFNSRGLLTLLPGL